jgi:hypothetical protein
MDSQIVEQATQQGRQYRPRGVLPIAVIQFVVSALIWVVPAMSLIDDAILRYRYPHSLTVASLRTHGYYEVVVILPLCLSLIGVFTGMGLLRLRNWARRVTLSMATVPVFACVAYLKLHHPKPLGDAMLVVGDFTNGIVAYLLVVLLPVSIWWWVFFMRADLRSRFR